MWYHIILYSTTLYIHISYHIMSYHIHHTDHIVFVLMLQILDSKVKKQSGHHLNLLTGCPSRQVPVNHRRLPRDGLRGQDCDRSARLSLLCQIGTLWNHESPQAPRLQHVIDGWESGISNFRFWSKEFGEWTSWCRCLEDVEKRGGGCVWKF